MADIKISDMTEQTDLTGVQAIGVKTVDNVAVPCRYNIGNVSKMISQAVNGVVKPDTITNFETTRNYYVGQFCVYNSIAYRFIKTHYAGAWLGNDAVQTDFWKEVSSVTSTDYETVKCVISFVNADNSQASETVEGRNVVMKFDDETSQTLATDVNGICTFTVRKGTHYVLSVSEVQGFAIPIDQEFIASLSSSTESGVTYGGRTVNFIYRPGTSANCTLTVNINVVGGTGAGYNGLVATVIERYGKTSAVTKTGTIVYDSGNDTTTVVFTGLRQGEYATFFLPTVGNYVVPDDKNFIVSGTTMSIHVDVVTSDKSGIYYVDGSDWNEYLYESYPGVSTGSYDPSTHPCVALHIAFSDLVSRGFDYYVRIADLTTSRTLETRQWSTKQNMLLPHVTTTYSTSTLKDYNGPTMTGYMIADSIALNADTSPAALYANNSKFTYNGTEYTGYIGTRVQWDVLLNNSVAIYTALTTFGYTGNFKTGTNWWSSTQTNANASWLWYSGGYWLGDYKTRSYYVLPFFAIR